MDRRGHRGRRRSQNVVPQHVFENPLNRKENTFLDSLFKFTLMSCLVILIYSMLQYYCISCNAKHDVELLLKNMTKLSENLSVIESNYNDLEVKVIKLSEELPRLQADLTHGENPDKLDSLGKGDYIVQQQQDNHSHHVAFIDV